ncbi:hypothetical protein BC937DRAFT_92358 [Endogone sp. FLAS-F59071]|nr:hypothetical protein BC937DRAFT_92358 [Endogone sp. FLAS-F59071]|eukprot:RUS15517.1 hypothetical protein BC937DRAFT_92358 [Endogone sp. FLAS-F59071]
MEPLPPADAANVFAWLSTVFCLVSCLVVTYVTVTSFNYLRLSLLFIAFVQLVITIANLLRSYDRVSRHNYFDFTRICDLIFADVLVMLMLSVAGGFYSVLKHFRVWYWGCIVSAAAGTLFAVLGTALADPGVEKELSDISYGIILVTVAATFLYTLFPLLRTKREKYGDSKAFAVGIWYFFNLTVILLIYIGLFVWEIISNTPPRYLCLSTAQVRYFVHPADNYECVPQHEHCDTINKPAATDRNPSEDRKWSHDRGVHDEPGTSSGNKMTKVRESCGY